MLIEPGVINTKFVENIMIPGNTRSISSYLLSSSSSPTSTTTSSKVAAAFPTNGSDSNTHSDNSKSDREITEYAGVVERFLSHYYPAMRNASSPKEVAKVVLESIDDSVVSTRQGANNNFHRYPVGDDAKFYAEAKRKMSDSELHSFVAKRILSNMQDLRVALITQ